MLAYNGNPVYLPPFNDRIYPNKWNNHEEIDSWNKPILVIIIQSFLIMNCLLKCLNNLFNIF